MKLLIRNKWFSIFKQSSEVKDETGEKDVMFIEGKFWTLTAKKFIKDLDGNVHYMVRNKFWRIFTRKALIYDAEGNGVAYRYLMVVMIGKDYAYCMNFSTARSEFANYQEKFMEFAKTICVE